MSSSSVARASTLSPETAASTRGSIWPRSARTKTWPASATTAGRISAGMLCSPAEAVIRPAAPSDPVQQPRNRPSATKVLVEPGVAVRGGYPFGFAPGEKGIDQRVRAGERPQPPCPRIGQLDPSPGEQRAHLSRAAQVDVARGSEHGAAPRRQR